VKSNKRKLNQQNTPSMRQISSETILDVEALTRLFSRRQITKESFNPRLLLGLTQTTQTF